jgi:undecaprenyl-diphosphatase
VGSFGAIWLLLAIAISASSRRRRWLWVQVGVAILVAEGVSGGLKLLLRRARPAAAESDPLPLVDLPLTFSFPSGHATVSFACATVLTFAIPRLVVPLYALAALIAFSRVYVGVHYPSDVLAGAVLGILLATALRMLAAARHRSAPPTQPG